MNSIKGTRTEKNLLASFAGESQARNRYNMFASAAAKEGLEQIADFFNQTADNERLHAKAFFKYLEGGEVEICASYPAGRIGSTAENLKAAAEGENMEHTVLYPEAARIAEEEGFPQIACLFNLISGVEVEHEKRYRKLLENLEKGRVFSREEGTRWVCRKCGYVHVGREAPKVCPLCAHPQAYFELECDNY
ncbi:MAG: rubrerythrin family protein [Candidatus Thermoplasmatota archaeon]|nr:rubrerythrin family protein [Candidatus Thermoplasmatota archaeon]